MWSTHSKKTWPHTAETWPVTAAAVDVTAAASADVDSPSDDAAPMLHSHSSVS